MHISISIGARGGAKKLKVGFEFSSVCFPILLYLDRHQKKFELPRCMGSASPGGAIFGLNGGENTKDMTIYCNRVLF